MDDIMMAAKDAMEKAYAPYSGYKVGAAIRGHHGVYCGCNVENSVFPEGTCAEAGAIAAMILAGETEIEEIFVIGSGDMMVTPCGGCRQKIAEFASKNAKVHLSNNDNSDMMSLSIQQLLPMAFSSKWLKEEK